MYQKQRKIEVRSAIWRTHKAVLVPSDVYRNARRVVEVTASSGHGSRWSTSYGLDDAAKPESVKLQSLQETTPAIDQSYRVDQSRL
jgi:hypothetical protein